MISFRHLMQHAMSLSQCYSTKTLIPPIHARFMAQSQARARVNYYANRDFLFSRTITGVCEFTSVRIASHSIVRNEATLIDSDTFAYWRL